jgi:sortase (surface protein transpeptidase)
MNAARSLPWQAALALPLAAGFFGASLSILASGGAHAMAGSTSAGMQAATAAAAPEQAPAPYAPTVNDRTATNEPARLIIPSFGLSAAVQSVGLSQTGNGAIGTPDNATDVAWYDRGPIPGSPGIAIIDGHLDTRTVPEAVFYHLGDLSAGQSVYVIDRAGVQQRFVVTSRQQLAYDADPSMLFAPSNTAQLALITCAGDWMPDKHEYTDRIVVLATLANQE